MKTDFLGMRSLLVAADGSNLQASAFGLTNQAPIRSVRRHQTPLAGPIA